MVRKTFMGLSLLVAMSGCAAQRERFVWRVRDVVLGEAPVVDLKGPKDRIMASIPRKTLQELMLAHLRICRAAGIEADLLLVNGEEPNAFAGLFNDRRAIGINLAMVKLIGDDINQYAALLGHEVAHWSKGHVDASNLRASTLKVIGTVVSVGLGAAGVPASGLITGVGLDLIDASFSRDQEREADAASVDYILATNYDPQGAIVLFEKVMKKSSGFQLVFLSSHPTDQERIERLRALIDFKRAPRKEAAVQ
jgi:predicted Zn-dependent protease